MTDFACHAQEYLQLRRGLGHQLRDAGRLLPRFVKYLDSIGADTITIADALTWVQRPDADPASSIWIRRMAVVRGFARYLSGIDPTTQVPPLGLITYRQRWRLPFIYSYSDIQVLVAAVPSIIPSPFRALTFQSMIGVLAACGMRVGEAIRLGRADIDWNDGVLVVHGSKFNKSRELPLDPTTITALAHYANVRDREILNPVSGTFFLSGKGTAVIYTDFSTEYRRLLGFCGIGVHSSVRPRLHDLRHTFAVHTLLRWYQTGEDVNALLPRLSTYLGHLEPSSTYWYLSAAPELLAQAVSRLETAERGRR